MNDRFRFRIWNPDLQSYDDNRDYNVAILVNQDFGLVLNPYRDNIIEMCTGLKDKNGNLIYEGDLIKDRGGIIYKIQWKDACFFAVAIDNFNYMPDSMLVQTWLNTWKAEIIGNIHEQAEQKDK